MRKQYRVAYITLIGLVVLLAASFVMAYQVQAHGSIQVPVSRVLNCYLEGPESPTSEACKAAVAAGGTQQFYDWNGINQLANRHHRALIPDGQLCSAGKESHKGLDLARDDWPAQTIAPDANGNFEFVYSATAPHASKYFEFYVTKDGYDPLKPLAWSDLEESPFCTINEVTLEDGQYKMNCPLPKNKSGKHVIYNIWQRSDSAEAFYSCVDVKFNNDEPQPTSMPSAEPTAMPSAVAPTETPVGTATTKPTVEPTTGPTKTPPAVPTSCSTPHPTPTVVPTDEPGNGPILTVTSGSIVGAPGSYFIISARNFPPNTAITLYINGIVLSDVQTDTNGAFTIVLVTTADTAPGNYMLSTKAPFDTAATITLAADAPLQKPAGQGEPLNMPVDLAPMKSIFLPVIQSGADTASSALEGLTDDPCQPTPEPTPTDPKETPEPTGMPASGKHIVGYYTSWSIYERDFHVMDIDAEKLTHINYAFANISDEGTCMLGDSYADVEKVYPKAANQEDESGRFKGNFRQLNRLKRQYPHLKTLIAVGGWTWSDKFSDVARTDESRQKFAHSCVDFMHKYGFDGIDIDWEYPVGGGEAGNVNRPEDKQNFTLLLRALQETIQKLEAADGHDYLLTIAAPAGAAQYNNLELDQIHQYVDWINVMTYDYHGSWEQQTNFNAPLYAAAGDSDPDEKALNVDATISGYRNNGVPVNKLVMGVPFYGRGWAGVGNTNNGLYQPSQGAAQGTWEASVFDYWDLVENYLGNGYTRYWNDEAKVPWLYNADKGVMISYDDADSIGIKADYLVEQELAGAMFWELSADVAGRTTSGQSVAANSATESPSLLDVLFDRLSVAVQPTPVATATPIATPVPPTETPVLPTKTPLPGETATQVPTAMPTVMLTATALPTQPPTSVPTDTPTNVPTDVPTAAPTATNTATSTATDVPPTAVPTMTFTPLPTGGPTATATPTADNPPSGADLVIDGIEVTQAIQDTNNSVPLVSNRTTFVRVLAKVSNGTADGVTVSITANREGQLLGTVDSPPKSVSSSPNRGNAGSTFNILLPASWRSGNVNLQVAVDSKNVINEANENNNDFATDLTFNNMPTYNLVLVPINYTHQGTAYPAPTTDNVTSFAWEVWPLDDVNISFHAPYNFSGNLSAGSEWERLADEIDTLKSSDNASSSTYYYGVVPIKNNNGRWWNGGIAGISGIGFRAGAGLDIGGNTFAHEIGHGFGLPHAPCGVGGDPNYPYAGASIGQFGFDQNGEVKLPGDYVDLMSYCSPSWVSDYNYKRVYNDQMSVSQFQASSQQQGLLIRASLSQTDAKIGATYALQARLTAAPTESEYSVQLLDATGQVIATHLIAARERIKEPLAPADRAAYAQKFGEELPAGEHNALHSEHAHGGNRTIHAVVPMPETAVATVRILHQGTTMAERTLQPQVSFLNSQASTATRAGDEVTLAWPDAETPVTVRFTADNGASWTTLAVDALGGLLKVNRLTLPNKGQGRFEIIPADSSQPAMLEAIVQ